MYACVCLCVCVHTPAVVTPQVPGELALAVQAASGLLVHQPPLLLGPQLLLELQSVRLLPQRILIPTHPAGEKGRERERERVGGGVSYACHS